MMIRPTSQLEFELLPSRALYWPSRQMLVVADLHLGRLVSRAPTFVEDVTKALRRVSDVLIYTQAQRLLFLGDLFHMRNAYHPDVVQAFYEWRERFMQTEMILVRGNHERAMGDPPSQLCLNCVNPGYEDGGVIFLHEPRHMHAFTMCAHLHPCLLVPTDRAIATTVPCFVWNQEYLYMPAFEDTIPGRVISRRFDEQYACIHNQQVVMYP
ncbi:MAG: metallophosphoesterase [Roseiflexaceae bacterium]